MQSAGKRVEVLVIGAGFGGIGVGINLLKDGVTDFVIIEAEDDVGGTWRTNRYPGCACDVPSHLYSYSFEPNPSWESAFSGHKDIERYIQHCADKYGVRPHIQFGTKVTRADFDEEHGRWRVETHDGRVFDARILVPATGGLSRLKYPEIPGRKAFEGQSVHAARWNPELSLEGKRVGVIGTGASAIQIVPSVANEVRRLSVFQRNAAWVLPKFNRQFTDDEHRRWATSPWRQRLRRLKVYWFMEMALPALLWFPKLLGLAEFVHKWRLKRTIKDPVLRRKLTPDYRIGCKRSLVSDTYLKTFCRENVDLVTDGIERIVPEGIQTTDGVTHPLDILIYATGYAAGAPAFPYEIRGLGGVSLKDYWGVRKRAYYGMNVAGFPNLVMIMGPNTAPGHTSVLVYQEPQYAYVVKYLRHLTQKRLRYLDVKESVQDAQFDEFQDRLKGSSWGSGCTSWYLNQDGTNSAIWPSFSFAYGLQLRRFHVGAYREVGSAASVAQSEASQSAGESLGGGQRVT